MVAPIYMRGRGGEERRRESERKRDRMRSCTLHQPKWPFFFFFGTCVKFAGATKRKKIEKK